MGNGQSVAILPSVGIWKLRSVGRALHASDVLHDRKKKHLARKLLLHNDTLPTIDRYNLSICEILPAGGGTQFLLDAVYRSAA